MYHFIMDLVQKHKRIQLQKLLNWTYTLENNSIRIWDRQAFAINISSLQHHSFWGYLYSPQEKLLTNQLIFRREASFHFSKEGVSDVTLTVKSCSLGSRKNMRQEKLQAVFF
jgi:hypothetical protein